MIYGVCDHSGVCYTRLGKQGGIRRFTGCGLAEQRILLPGMCGMVPSTLLGSVVRFGIFEFHPRSGELLKQGRRVRLSGQPAQILAFLLRRPGEMIRREELQQALWPADTHVNFDQSLNAAMKRLRQRFGRLARQTCFHRNHGASRLPFHRSHQRFRTVATSIDTAGSRGPFHCCSALRERDGRSGDRLSG